MEPPKSDNSRKDLVQKEKGGVRGEAWSQDKKEGIIVIKDAFRLGRMGANCKKTNGKGVELGNPRHIPELNRLGNTTGVHKAGKEKGGSKPHSPVWVTPKGNRNSRKLQQQELIGIRPPRHRFCHAKREWGKKGGKRKGGESGQTPRRKMGTPKCNNLYGEGIQRGGETIRNQGNRGGRLGSETDVRQEEILAVNP